MPTPAPRVDQHDPARARAHRSRTCGRRSRRSTSTTPTRPPSCRTRSWCWQGLAPRGPLHGRARAAPDRHHRLRRPRAARDDLDGAHRLLPVLRPPLPAARPPGDPPGGRGPLELDGDPAISRARMGLRDPALRQERGRPDPRGAGLGRRLGGRHHARAPGATSARCGCRWAGPICRSRTARPPRPARSSSSPRRWPRDGLPALPTYVPLVEGPEHAALLARYPLQCIVPPNRFFLNSSFSQSERLRAAPARPRGPAAPGRRGRARHRRRRPGAGAQRARGRRGSPPS